MTGLSSPDALSVALAAGGISGSLLRAALTKSQAFWSQKSAGDVTVGFLVGFLYPLYPLIDFPVGATLTQKAVMVAAVAYLTGDVLINGLAQLSSVLQKLNSPLLPPPKS